MLIQAYRRKSDSTHEVNDIHYKFSKNERGHFVCDVEDDEAIARFLAIDEGFKPYGDAASRTPATSTLTPKPEGDGPFALVNGDERVDLGAMTDGEVKQFADEQEVKYDGRLKGDKLREAVKAAVLGK
jgi:hypothetical protein